MQLQTLHVREQQRPRLNTVRIAEWILLVLLIQVTRRQGSYNLQESTTLVTILTSVSNTGRDWQ